jgi:menaquinone-dependent protoporphyrinogen IX oxidase
MRVLVVYDTIYGSTAQIAAWIAERLEGFEDAEVAVSRVSEDPNLAEYDAVIIGSPICRNDQILESITRFVTKNNAALAEKKVGIFVVALDTGGAYYFGRLTGGLEYLKEFAGLFAKPPVYGKVLGGEQIPTRLSAEDRESLLNFYRRMIGTDEIPYRYNMDKPKVWEYAARFYRYANR